MWVSFDSESCGQYGAPTSPTRCYTDFLMQRSLRLNVILFKFVVELFESFEVLDSDTHLLDFLSQSQGMVSSERGGSSGNQYLTEHEIPLGQLDEHLLGTKRVVELEFEILDLLFGILEHYEDGFVGVCERLCQGLGKAPNRCTYSVAPPG